MLLNTGYHIKSYSSSTVALKYIKIQIDYISGNSDARDNNWVFPHNY